VCCITVSCVGYAICVMCYGELCDLCVVLL